MEEKQLCTYRVTISMSKELREKIRVAAANAAMSTACWIRKKLEKEVSSNKS